jgi:hypothetical protein
VAPFALGDSQVKYLATACSGQHQYDKRGDSPYYLRDRLQARLDPRANGTGLCFNLAVQLRNDAHTQPTENTLVPWKISETGWQNVATIEIPPQTFPSSAQEAFCERLTFNPYHGLKAHEPIGGINRARGVVMQQLQKVRFEANGWKRPGPHDLTGGDSFN